MPRQAQAFGRHARVYPSHRLSGGRRCGRLEGAATAISTQLKIDPVVVRLLRFPLGFFAPGRFRGTAFLTENVRHPRSQPERFRCLPYSACGGVVSRASRRPTASVPRGLELAMQGPDQRPAISVAALLGGRVEWKVSAGCQRKTELHSRLKDIRNTTQMGAGSTSPALPEAA